MVAATLMLLIVGMGCVIDARGLAPRLHLASRHATVAICANGDGTNSAHGWLATDLHTTLLGRSSVQKAVESLTGHSESSTPGLVDGLQQDISFRVVHMVTDRRVAIITYTGSSLLGTPLIEHLAQRYASHRPAALAAVFAARVNRLVAAKTKKSAELHRLQSNFDSMAGEVSALHNQVKQARLVSFSLERTEPSARQPELASTKRAGQFAGLKLSQRLAEQTCSLRHIKDLCNELHHLEQQLFTARQHYQQAMSLSLFAEPAQQGSLRDTIFQQSQSKLFGGIAMSAFALLAMVRNRTQEIDDVHGLRAALNLPITVIRIPDCVAA